MSACPSQVSARQCLPLPRPEATMRFPLLNHLPFGLLAAGILLSTSPALAQTPSEFYRGKTVTMIVSSASGGAYDALSRVLAVRLCRHIPGNQPVIVRNMAGAGGIVATNHLYSLPAKDGTVVGGVQNNTPFEPLLGTKAATYDPLKFNWLGTPSYEVAIASVWHTTPVNSWQDTRTREITMGSSGVNSTPSFYGRLLIDTLGMKMKIIVGYESQTHAFLAMERGEIDGYPSVFYNSLMSTRPTWHRDKQVKLLVQMGLEKEPAIPEVPYALDLVSKEDDKLLLTAAFAPL